MELGLTDLCLVSDSTPGSTRRRQTSAERRGKFGGGVLESLESLGGPRKTGRSKNRKANSEMKKCLEILMTSL